MKKLFLFLSLCFSLQFIAQSKEQISNITQNYNRAKISEKIIESKQTSTIERKRAEDAALRNNWPLRKINEDGSVYELIKLDPFGKPLYYETNDAAQVTSTRVNHLNSGGSLGLNLNGQGMVARVWDGGKVRLTHNYFGGRAISVDDVSGTTLLTHATHVTGSIIASNTIAANRGVAFAANARTFNWTDDQSEVLSEVLGGMLLSNHSYGIPLINSSTLQPQNPLLVGSYIEDSRAWDEIAYLAPYYLMVASAGNSGTEDNSDPSTYGFDKLIGNKVSKNNLVVANCQDVVVNSAGVLTSPVLINSSSSQGPADDRRIKPDITGNGTGVVSASSTGDSATANLTGTSMASPNVMGTLLLVQQHANAIGNNFLKAATLKGLATHTADDCGQIGPDAVFGWGLLNAKKCVETLNQNGLSSWVSEEVLKQGQTFTMNVKAVGGSIPLIVSATWTDVPGVVNTSGIVNSIIPSLVNDIDVRISRAGVSSFPWSLTSDASAPAVQNIDNKVDNIENVSISVPVAGDYTISITHKGNLVGGKQPFSLVITGVTSNIALNSTSSDLSVCSNTTAAYTFNYKQVGVGTSVFTAQGLPPGMSATFTPTSLAADGIVTMTLSNLSAVAAGTYAIGIKADNGSETEIRYRNITVFSDALAPVSLVFPSNNQLDVAAISVLRWSADVNFESYKLEVATDMNFANIFFTQSGLTKNFQKLYNLVSNVRYYWRVVPSNRCVNGSTATAIIRSFVVGIANCGNSFVATDFSNSTIAAVADSYASVPIVVSGGMTVGNLKVSLNINHTYVQDLSVSLIGPASIGSPEVVLLSQTCGEFNDISASFSDDFPAVICGSVAPSISGQIAPIGELSNFNNLVADGTWILNVSDPFDGDGGNVNSVLLDFCNVSNSLAFNNFTTFRSTITPNPAKDSVDIVLNDTTGTVYVDVFDLSGRIVGKHVIDSFENIYNLDVSNYHTGIYLLDVRSDRGTVTHKLIKE